MKQNYIKLYGTGSLGINVWEAWSEGSTIHIHANGTFYTASVQINQSGRSMDEQVKLELTARARKKLDQGFKRTQAELGKHITNQLGLAAPMLATPIGRVNISLRNCFAQPKLDGHRCLIGGEGAYSRRGKVIDTIPEILNSLDIPDGAILDGELYYHGVPLQTIASWAKRRQANTLKLRYHIYDIIIPGMPFVDRQEVLKELNYGKEHVTMVETVNFDNSRSPFDYCREYIDQGYEGAIIRPAQSLYDIGKRSKSLIKVKLRLDGEYMCVDVEKSADGWGILILKTPEGKYFRTSAPGDHTQKREALINKHNYIGRLVTCEYAELTKDKIPFHCVAIRWRKDI